MYLQLSSKEWWWQIAETQLPDWVKNKLRGAITAYFHNVHAPTISLHELQVLSSYVKGLTMDGTPLDLIAEPGEDQIRRLRLVFISELTNMAQLVIKHAQVRAKRGRGPSMPYRGEFNPRRALQLATTEENGAWQIKIRYGWNIKDWSKPNQRVYIEPGSYRVSKVPDQYGNGDMIFFVGTTVGLPEADWKRLQLAV